MAKKKNWFQKTLGKGSPVDNFLKEVDKGNLEVMVNSEHEQHKEVMHRVQNKPPVAPAPIAAAPAPVINIVTSLYQPTTTNVVQQQPVLAPLSQVTYPTTATYIAQKNKLEGEKDQLNNQLLYIVTIQDPTLTSSKSEIRKINLRLNEITEEIKKIDVYLPPVQPIVIEKEIKKEVESVPVENKFSEVNVQDSNNSLPFSEINQTNSESTSPSTEADQTKIESTSVEEQKAIDTILTEDEAVDAPSMPLEDIAKTIVMNGGITSSIKEKLSNYDLASLYNIIDAIQKETGKEIDATLFTEIINIQNESTSSFIAEEYTSSPIITTELTLKEAIITILNGNERSVPVECITAIKNSLKSVTELNEVQQIKQLIQKEISEKSLTDARLEILEEIYINEFVQIIAATTKVDENLHNQIKILGKEGLHELYNQLKKHPTIDVCENRYEILKAIPISHEAILTDTLTPLPDEDEKVNSAKVKLIETPLVEVTENLAPVDALKIRNEGRKNLIKDIFSQTLTDSNRFLLKLYCNDDEGKMAAIEDIQNIVAANEMQVNGNVFDGLIDYIFSI